MKAKLKERLQCRDCKMPYCDALCTDLSDEQIEWVMELANQRVIAELESLHIYPDTTSLKHGFKGDGYVKEIDVVYRIKQLKQN